LLRAFLGGVDSTASAWCSPHEAERIAEVDGPVDWEVSSLDDEGLVLSLSAGGALCEDAGPRSPTPWTHEVTAADGSCAADLVMEVGETALHDSAS